MLPPRSSGTSTGCSGKSLLTRMGAPTFMNTPSSRSWFVSRSLRALGSEPDCIPRGPNLETRIGLQSSIRAQGIPSLMHAAFGRQTHRKIVAGILLVTLMMRALMPPGFMPAPGHGIALQICPDGLPSHVFLSALDRDHATHHSGGAPHHHHGSLGAEHCVFAALAAGAGAPNLAVMPQVPLASPRVRPLETTSPASRSPRHSAQQPRAPPL